MHQDTETIALLQQGDKTALGILYDKYGAALFGVILRVVQSKELAEEVMQEAFLKIWRNAANYDESKGKFFTWALNIARNTAIDATRSSDFRKSQKTVDFDILVYCENHPATDLPVDGIGLREIVNKIDEKYRRVIDLAYFQGYTQTEIEQEMNIPIGTVKTRLRLAIKELRKVFQ
ncbi:MAG: sigma-70 family RNA polymerase sigma factor [Bacteroidetes bacterium]|nr:sigma-70 family RNA polymerase sigma factor [Bacteroidota bacterium]